MKKSSVLVIATTLLLSSCGMVAQYASSDSGQKFQDGIYNSTPDFTSKAEKAVSKAETDALVEKTKASRIYLFGEKKDSVMIPENMSARIQYDKELGSTVVTVGDNPYDWQNNINPWSYYTPYSIGSSWYWSRHYDPWYWNTWAYSPWRYGGWYDPWYYGYSGWYGGWYDPWYGYMYPHYCGWYGGWDPYWGHHHHHHGPIYVTPDRDDRWQGPRRHTGSDRVFTSRVSTRGGVAGSGATRSGRVVSGQTSSVRQTASSAVRRTSAVRVATGTPSRTSAIKATSSTVRKAAVTATRPALSTRQTVTGRPTAASSNHRKPAVTHTTDTFRPGTSTGSSQAVSGSNAPYRSSSSSYSSGSSSSRSSYSGGSASRSGGSYSSGGASRSGGSSAGRR